MKIWVRIKFCADSIGMHLREVLAGVLLLGVTLLLVALVSLVGSRADRELRQVFRTDTDQIGYVWNQWESGDLITIEQEDAYLNAAKDKGIVREIGSYGYGPVELEELQFLRKIQGDHVYQIPSNKSWYEGVMMSPGMWNMLQLKLAEGMAPEAYDLEQYTPIYLGAAYQGHIKVGTIIESQHASENDYIVAGILRRGTRLPTEHIYMLDKFDVYCTYPGDHAVISITTFTGSYPWYFELQDGVSFEEAEWELLKLAEDQGMQVEIDSMGAQLDLLQTSLKQWRQYMLEIILVIGITACIVVTCYQTITVMSRRTEYGILYANGATTGDLLSFIVLENSMKLILALIFIIPILLILSKEILAYTDAEYYMLKLMIRQKIIWEMGAVGVLMMLISSLLPMVTLKRYTPVELIGGNET